MTSQSLYGNDILDRSGITLSYKRTHKNEIKKGNKSNKGNKGQ